LTELDNRLHAFRRDLADISLRGKVEAETFVEPKIMQVVAPIACVRSRPDRAASFTTQALMGDVVKVFEHGADWSWGQLEKDNYVGYFTSSDLAAPNSVLSHRVCVPATFIYPLADLKSQPATRIFLNSWLEIKTIEGDWAELESGGFVWSGHLADKNSFSNDPVSIAEQFVGVPYLWGGNSADGIDCSALVQQAYRACNLECPRDTDMIERQVGNSGFNSKQRGDLVFWDGHIGMMLDGENMIHANGHHMAVAKENLEQAAERVAKTYGSSYRTRRP